MMSPLLFSLSFPLVLFLLLFPTTTHSYTWKFRNNPRQCSKLTVEIEGNDGQAPYNILILPYGPAPGQYETRAVETITFNKTDDGNDGKRLDFTLNYPTESSFVAVVSDRNGFGTGGTSDAWKVRSSSDNSCFDNTKVRRPKWPYFYLSTDGIRSCEPSRVYWNSSNPNITGTVNFVGVIPHGISFNITTAPLYDVPNNLTGTTGFDFTPPVAQGTELILVSGDEGATGTGGYVPYRVAPPQNPANTNCVPNMPSVTAGLAAGGDPSVDLDSSSGTNIGAIVGGVVGGVIFLICVGVGTWLCLRRRQRQQDHNRRAMQFDPKVPTPFSFTVASTPSPTDTQTLTPFPPGGVGQVAGTSYSDNVPLSPNRKHFPGNFPPSQPQITYVRHEDAEDIAPGQTTIDLPPAYKPHRQTEHMSGRPHPHRTTGSVSSVSSTSGARDASTSGTDRKVRPSSNSGRALGAPGPAGGSTSRPSFSSSSGVERS